jgi:biopolymer transport protein ExbD
VPKPPKAFDVWFVAANTVYKAVPYNVVADWAQQGRLAATDMVRPTGTNMAWVTIAEHEFLSDYLPRPAAAKAVPAVAAAGAAFEVVEPGAMTAEPASAEPAELPDPEPVHPRRAFDEEDDVDMIPLIDISMVLLVFFIMIRAAGALAPVDVPEMRYAGQLTSDPEAITISIEKLNEAEVYYSVRRGQEPARPSHDLLATPEAAIKALDELLADAQRPPEVRIACRKDLPRERVYELRRELEGRQQKNYINNFVATVVEAPQEK